MKRLQLLFTIILSLLSSTRMWGQGWTAQAPADGDFYLYNVGTGTFLSCGSETWGTKACINNGALNFTLEGNGAGAYTLYTTSTFTYGSPNSAQLQSSGYVDQSVTATTWTFTPVGGMDNTYTLLNAAGTYLVAPSDGTKSILLESTAPTTAYGYWKLVNYANLFPETASEINPVNISCLIGDANFESSNVTMKGFWTMVADNQNLCGADIPNNCAESWKAAFTLSQTITVPNGYYRLRAQAAVTEYAETGANLPVVYALSNGTEVTTPFVSMTHGEKSMTGVSTQFTAGEYYTDYTEIIRVSNGSLTVGAKGTRTDTWAVWDNFQLMYMGAPIIEDGTYYFKNEGTGLYLGGATSWGTQATLIDVGIDIDITANATGTGYTLDTKLSNGGASHFLNGQWMDGAATATYFTETSPGSGLYTLSQTTAASDYYGYDGTNRAVVTNLSDASSPNAQWRLVTKAQREATLSAATATNGVDATFLLDCYRFNRNDTRMDAWTNDGITGGNESYTTINSGGDQAEYAPQLLNNTFNLHQSITGLPNGVYEVSVAGFGRGGRTILYANSTETPMQYGFGDNYAAAKTAIANGTMTWERTGRFRITDGNLTFGVKRTGTVDGDDWTVFNNFRLTYYGPYQATEPNTNVTITNPVVVRDATGWTTSVSPTFDANKNCSEFYNKSGATISQTLENQPAGYYTLTAVAFTRTGYTATLSADGESMNIATVASSDVNNLTGANTWFNAGNCVNTLKFYHAADEDITITLTAATEGDRWTVWRSFSLVYNGAYDISTQMGQLAEIVAEAEAMYPSLPTAAKNTLKAVVDAQNINHATGAACNTAISTIRSAITTATAFVEPYSRFLSVKANVLALKEQTTKFSDRAGSASFTALDAAVSTQQTAADAAANTAAIETAIVNLRKAASAFAGAITLERNQYLDLTDAMLYNPELRDGVDGDLGGWIIDSNSDPSFPKHTNHRASEFWQANFEFHQEVPELPAGFYNIEVSALHRAGTYNTYLYANSDNIQIVPLANGENSMDDAADAFDLGKYINSLKIELAATTDVNIGFKNEDNSSTDKWTIFRDFKIKFFGSDGLAVYREEYEEALSIATEALGNSTYTNVGGTDRSNLYTAVNTTYPTSVVETDETQLKYETARDALRSLAVTFKAGVTQWNAYKTAYDLAVTEKAKADAINASIHTTAIPTATGGYNTATTGAVDMTATLNALVKTIKMEEYEYVIANYPTDIPLGAWTAENAGNMTGQHWDGTNVTQYQEQAEGNYASSTAWSTSYTQDIELPTGTYVFKVAGRHSEHSTLTLTVTDVTGGGSVQLGTISDFPVGDTGLGINTSGATDFTTGEGHTYANAGNGRGWEWRYVPFLLDNGEEMATIRISVVGANPDALVHQWVGFCNYTVQTGPSVAASTVRYNQEKALAEAARDDATYANVQGTDRSNLLAAIAADKGSTIESIDAAADAISTATTNFTTGVTQWNTYKAAYDLAVAEKAKADAINASIHSTAIPTATGGYNTATTGAVDMTTTLNDLVKTIKVEEYTYVTGNYTTSVLLGDWTATGGTTFNRGGQHWSGDASRGYWEQTTANYSAASWDISFHQTITLPAGDYIFKVAGRHASGGDVTMSLDVTKTSDESSLGSVNDFPATHTGKGIDTSGAANFGSGTFSNGGSGNGWEWRYVPFTLAVETEIKVAVTASATATGKWISFSDYEVLAIPNVAISTLAYDQAYTAATTARDNATYTNVQGTDRSNLVAAIAAEKGSTPSEIDAATLNLREKTATFTAGVASWDAYASSKVPVVVSELPYASPAKWSTLNTTVAATVNTAAEAATQATAINNANRLYVESNAMAEGVEGAVDITAAKILQPNAPDTYAGITAWTPDLTITSGGAATMDVRNATPCTQGNGSSAGYYYDGGDLWGTTAYTMDFYQNVTLNPGSYLLTVTSRASADLKTFQLYADGNTLNLGKEGNTGQVFGGGWNDYSVAFSFEGAPKSVKLGLYIEMDATHNWWSASRFRLVQLKKDVTLDESVAYTPEYGAARVTLNRTFNSNWATFVVPFDIDNATLKAKFGNDVQVSEFSHNEQWAISFEPMAEPAITANTPVLMKTSTAASSFTFDNVIIEEDEPIVHANTDLGIDVIGHYGGRVSIPGDDGDYLYYYIASNKMKHSTGSQYIKGYRAYFKAEDSSLVKAFFEGLDFGDLETGINMSNSEKKEDVIYNLAGQRVSKATKGGIYIVNGKKVLVK